MAIIEATANLKIESQKKTPTLKEERGAKSVIIIILLLARGAWRCATTARTHHATRNTAKGAPKGRNTATQKPHAPAPPPAPAK